MLYEYAVEPEALGTWQSLRFFLDQFGVGTGRLLAKYPKGWEAMVLCACSEIRPIAKHRHTEGLRVLKQRLSKTKRPYDDEKPWIPNAEAAHRIEPFRAIIVESAELKGNYELRADEIGPDTERWFVPSDGKVARTANDLAQLLAPLLHHASEVLFVDPHFCCAAKFGKPLSRFFAEARIGKTPHTVQYHLSAKATPEFFAQDLQSLRRFLRLENDDKIDFIRWNCLPEGENQHPRYVLTNRGGVSIDYGLDEGNGTTDWRLLSESLWKERRQQFLHDSTAFAFVDGFRMTAATVTPLIRGSNGWLPK